ncbi:Flp pilus assembly protein CpaB [Polynucleobacter kasalickyi]|uniref:Pilus assembly protein CpaB n=1 Tax=Polynucleobacter kasalickyi TaxID=1938817 RepID=A0A1W1Y4W1_9BURK|nr:Flp pilus assembly protein CpaB [Polynucleobacter kasalickyi]SMC30861.1 pilus assembly protein CpaB [Polynucleobacter kasalickyi]
MNILPNNKFLIAILASAFIGVSVVIVAAIWLKKIDSVEMSEIVVAADKLDLGVKLDKKDLQLSNWPKGNIPVGAVKSIDQLINRTPKMEIAKGEVILERMLFPISSNGSLSVQISPGKRAFTMSVNEAAGVAGFAMPGNFVDVMLNSKDQNSQEISRIIIHKILVLAVAQDRLSDDSKPKVVNAITIELTPSQAEILDLARSIGSVSLVLRQQNDNSYWESSGVTKKDLVFNIAQTKPPIIKEIKGKSVEVIRGLSKESAN